MARSTFVVGRRNAKTMVLVLRQAEVTPIVGPWTLTAVVSAS